MRRPDAAFRLLELRSGDDQNLGIDWRRPLFSTGTVVGVDAHTVTFRPLPDGALQGGEPVVSFQTARADGVPSGICLFEGLAGWSGRRRASFEFTAGRRSGRYGQEI